MTRILVWALIFITLLAGAFMGGMVMQMSKPTSNKEVSDNDTLQNTKGVKYVRAEIATPTSLKLSIDAKGRVIDGQQISVIAEAQGRLIPGDISLKKGSTFKKGQLIARIDNSEAELLLKARKSSFINLVANVLPDIKIDYSENHIYWNKFFELIAVGNALPDLPPFKGSDQEFVRFRNFLVSKNVMTEYYSIRSEEERFRKYYIHAPFDGSITESFTDLGSVINPGSPIVRIAKKDVKEIEVPVSNVSIAKIYLNADVDVTTEKGEKMKGKVVRKSDFINPLSQSVSVFIEIVSNENTLYSGQYVNVSISGPTLPMAFKTTRRAIQANNTIYVVKDSALYPIDATIEHYTENDVILSNINANEVVVIEPILDIKKGQKVASLISNSELVK
jgi:membrane fusion protein, multidrug efflux system